MKRPEQRPEGKLIGDALEGTGLSARKASAQAGMSDARWRHIVNGYQPAGRGEYVRVVAPADTLARMARVVGVTPLQLTEAGRSDAGRKLASMLQAERAGDDTAASRPVLEAIRADPDLLDEAKAHLINQYGLLLRVSERSLPEQAPEQPPLKLAARKRQRERPDTE